MVDVIHGDRGARLRSSLAYSSNCRILGIQKVFVFLSPPHVNLLQSAEPTIRKVITHHRKSEIKLSDMCFNQFVMFSFDLLALQRKMINSEKFRD